MELSVPIYPDIWACITEFLPWGSIRKLLAVGNEHLSSVVFSSVRYVYRDQPAHFLDLGALMSQVKRFTVLKELDIRTSLFATLVKRPIEPFELPRNLSSLSFHVDEIFSLVVPLKLSELLPGLISLELAGFSNNLKFEFEDLDLPPALESLTILTWAICPRLHPAFVAKLPRTLLRLALRCDAAWASPTWRESSPPNPTFDWPSLTHADLTCQGLTLEYLPRTLSSLKIVMWSGTATTKFPQDCSNTLVSPFGTIFPWRRFFPRMTSIDVSSTTIRPLYPILATIVLDTVLDSETVDNFIASGFWNQPSLQHFKGRVSDEAYPTFKTIKIPHMGDTGRLTEQFNSVAPFIKTTDFPHSAGTLKFLSLLEGTKKMILHDSLVGNTALSKSVTSLSCREMVTVSLLPPHLKSLLCVGLYVKDKDSQDGNHDALPESLTSLELIGTSLPIVLANAALSNLRVVSFNIDAPQNWETIAEHLVCLENLTLNFTDKWVCDHPLRPMASKVLTILELNSPFSLDLQDLKPKMGELFSKPSIFPLSLTSLELGGEWHGSVLALLPRNLKKLEIKSRFDWSTKFKPYPEALGMSHEDLLRCLSPKLEILILFGPVFPTSPNPSVRLVEYLPRSLNIFTCSGLFDKLELHPFQELKSLELGSRPLLPPNLAKCTIDMLTVPQEYLHPFGRL